MEEAYSEMNADEIYSLIQTPSIFEPNQKQIDTGVLNEVNNPVNISFCSDEH